jgi:hypothetical protein
MSELCIKECLTLKSKAMKSIFKLEAKMDRNYAEIKAEYFDENGNMEKTVMVFMDTKIKTKEDIQVTIEELAKQNSVL